MTIEEPFGLMLNLDLDGVFADFEGGVEKICGKKLADLPKNRMWSIVHSKKDFFRQLDRLEEGLKLWRYVEDVLHKQHGIPVRFLTGAPSSQAFRDQKKEWVAEHKGEKYECIVLPKKDKQLYSGPWKVLIDDTQVNIDQWVAKGGFGLFYNGTAQPTIDELGAVVDMYMNRDTA
jgi:hypothetical protein